MISLDWNSHYPKLCNARFSLSSRLLRTTRAALLAFGETTRRNRFGVEFASDALLTATAERAGASSDGGPHKDATERDRSQSATSTHRQTGRVEGSSKTINSL